MQITVNDRILEIADNASLQDALNAKEIAPQGIATALNGRVIPAQARAATILHEGDKIVIIKAFYGG